MKQGDALRILYVLPYAPSPIRVRPYQIIRHLARIGHEITVVALDDGFSDPVARREMEEVCAAFHIVPHPKARAAANCAAALATPTPLWAAWTHSPPMSRLLRELSGSGKFDIAHVEHLRAARFARDLGTLPRLIDAVDCITSLRRQMLDLSGGGFSRQRLLSWEEWTKLRRYEPRAYKAFARVVVTSAFDAGALFALDPLLPPLDVIANGVDLDYFQPTSDPPEPDCVVFSGKMSYQANDDAALFLLRDVLPRLRDRRPGVRVVIAGSRPTGALQSLALRTEGATVTGYVDDLRPHLSRASVAICPLRVGVGIQNKALEAMSMGRPVVCTPLAARALAPQAGESGAVRVASEAQGLARACADLLSRPDEARRVGQQARHYVENHHDWKAVADRFTALYGVVLHG